MHMTNFAYDGPISLVPLSLSYANLPVLVLSSKSIVGIETKLQHDGIYQ